MTLPWSLPPLSPTQNGTVAVTSTTQRIALGTPLPGSAPTTVQIANVGTKEAFVKFGLSTVTATAQGAITSAADGDTSVPAGAILTFSSYGATHIAAICGGADTTTLRICLGIGS